MDYARIKEIAKNHHLEMSYPLYDAMKQAAGEAAQEMKGKYLDALHRLNIPDELLTELNIRNSNGPGQNNGDCVCDDHIRIDCVVKTVRCRSNHPADPDGYIRNDDWLIDERG